AGLSGAFQMPATAASITMMVPKEQLGRANGMMSLIYSTSNVAAPLLAGALIGVLGIGGIMMIDVVTFLFAAISTALIQIPQPTSSAEMEEDQGSIWQGYTFGFRYIFQRPSLLGVQLIFFFFNLTSIFEMALRTPLILARTGENEQILGCVLSISGVGGVLGGIVMSTWGGPKKRIHGVLGGMIVAAFLGIALMGLGQSLIVWGIAAFWMVFCIPFINGSNQAIWQAKVPPALQGRVFSARRVIAQASYLIGFVVAGPLADRVFDPAMQEGGSLAVLFGGIFGVGDVAGIGLFITLCGILGVLFSASGYLIPAVRNVETLIPDHKEPK
ncbi:MAG: MFS transporter, partial [Chloroflexota bacterium]